MRARHLESLRPGWVALALSLMPGLSGCLYHGGWHQLATSAQQSFKEAKLSQGIDEERKLSDEMLQGELAAAQRHGEALRNFVLAISVQADVTQLRKQIDDRLAQLVSVSGGNEAAPTLVCPQAATPSPLPQGESAKLKRPATASEEPRGRELSDQIDKAYKSIERSREALLQQAFVIAATGPEELPDSSTFVCQTTCRCTTRNTLECNVEPPLDEKWSEYSKELWSVYKRYCDDHGLARAELELALAFARRNGAEKPTGSNPTSTRVQPLGRLGIAIDERAAVEAEYEIQVKSFTDLKTSLDQAKESLKKAQAAGPLSEAVQKAKEVLEKAVADLHKAAGFGGIEGVAKQPGIGNILAAEALLEGKLAEATGVLDRLLKNETAKDPAVEQIAASILKLEQIERDKLTPRLLFEIQRLDGLRQVAQARVSHMKRRMELGEERVAYLVRELDMLTDARKQAATAEKNCAAKLKLHELLGTKGSSDCRQSVARALLSLANSWTLGEIPARRAEVETTGDIHAQALDASAAAIAMWEGVIGVPMEEIVKRYSSGVKPEQLAKMILDVAGYAGVAVGAGLGK